MSHSLRGKDQLTDDFVDKMLQEIYLMNLKNNLRGGNYDKDEVLNRLKTGKGTMMGKKNNLEIFDYKPNKDL